MKDLQPIGLCNVIYKIISKVLTSFLQPYMNSMIDTEQSAFTSNHFISNNILINHEVMHSLKLRRKYRNYSMAIKLDIIKDYKCVEWPYLEYILNFWLQWHLDKLDYELHFHCFLLNSNQWSQD